MAHQWRYGVVAVEALLAAGCLYAGWQAVAPEAVAAPIRVHHPASAPAGLFGAGTSGALVLPAGTGSPHPGAPPKRTFQAPNLTADWLSQLNSDDYSLYRGQWQTLQLLMSGVRQYLEQRVVPRLLGHWTNQGGIS